ncbi:MAG: tRNA-specific 2-thiouridylase [Parcubacteria group bacterium Gr01-1014_73]|nr:MAG: tRNA-specific 2-thiouridylase [Parcubacteria group bacterium Gr01-1014_73]
MNSQLAKKKKVFVGLSGGVDSSVSVALLKKQGYEVFGVFIKGWHPDWGTCGWREDRLDAMRVCAHLGIPFRDLDLSREYKKEVVDYMVSEYKVGRTPNPDVMCNRYIKFGAFFDYAVKNGADFVATGHYARVEHDTNTRMFANDTNKDQTYFLWTLTQRELSRTLFPIGHLIKPEVRKLAKKFGLPTVEKKDSQGLCFVGKVDLPDFLSHFLKPKRGKVLLENGKVIGWHTGAFFLTIGQRHGFTITKKTPADAPYYIVAKDIKKNTITVSQKTERPNLSGSVILCDVNWISNDLGAGLPSGSPAPKFPLLARFRYRQPLQAVSLERLNLKSVKRFNLKVIFQNPQSAIAPGQSLVIYSKKGECLGGGIIV